MTGDRIREQIDALLDRATEAADAEDWERVANLASRVLAIDPDQPDAHALLAMSRSAVAAPASAATDTVRCAWCAAVIGPQEARCPRCHRPSPRHPIPTSGHSRGRTVLPALVGGAIAVSMVLVGAFLAFALVSPDRFEATYPVPTDDEWVGSGPVADRDVTCPGVGQRVCILAIGSPHTADVDVDALAAYFEDTYELPITVLPPIDLAGMERTSGELVDHERNQLKGDALLEQLKIIYPALWAETQITLVALTPHDIFDSRAPDVDYLYSVRATRPGRFVVVSSARMDDAAWGDEPGDGTIPQRTRKLVARELGALHFGLNFSDDPTSVMAGVFGSRARIDRVNERLPVEELVSRRPELIARDTIKTFNGNGRGGTGIFEVEPGTWDYCGLISAASGDGTPGVRLSLYTEAGVWLTSASGKGSSGSLPCIGFTGPGRFEVRGYALDGVVWSVSVGPRDAVQPDPPLLPVWDSDATTRLTPVSTADGVVTFEEAEGGWTPWFRPTAAAWSFCWEAYAVPNSGRVAGQNEYLAISVLLEQEWDHLAERTVADPQPGQSGCFQLPASQPNGRHWILFNDAADFVGFRYTLNGVELAD